MESVLRHFGARQRRQDPVVHFYETFLAAYDPRLREARGVYYTPEPVVSYIVRSVDEILRTSFDCPDGLADTQSTPRPDGERPRVLILDPAVGTGTFLYGVVDHIREGFRDSNDAGKWSAYVRDHLLPRVFGFELLMAPYAVAHLKLGLQLAAADLPAERRSEWRYSLEHDQRLGVFLTNTLEEAIQRSDLLLGAYISEEANLAAEIKRELPIMVVLGNPPYSGHSANRGEWIRGLVQQEYVAGVDGLDRPAQAKWLQDDYVKFIRFGQWRIERSGEGVVAFITNHAYLDNPTFRGMRASLMRTFSDIYVLDLHGNANRRERDLDGGEDANVFDIKQGVAIALFVKRAGHEGPARVHRADVYGPRQAKYEWLDANDRASTPWRTIEPGPPFWLFTDEDAPRRDEFYAGTSIAAIFDQAGDPAPGIVTTHDQFAISFDRDEAIAKVERLLASATKAEAEQHFRLCSQDQWRYKDAKAALGANDGWRERVVPVDYRPFDRRVTVWSRHVAVHRRVRVSRHMVDGTNLALVSVGQVAEGSWTHALVSRHPIDARLTTSNRGIAFEFPLYLLPWSEDDPDRPAEGTLDGLFDDQRRPNLDPALMTALSARLGLAFRPDGPGDLARDFGPEDVFHYIYAILNAPSYRERYVPFLKYDFAHVPLDVEPARFRTLVTLGRTLAGLHLLEAPELRARRTSFPVPGANVVASRHPVYLPPGAIDDFSGEPTRQGRVYISPDQRRPQVRGQFVEGVSPGAWAYQMGGYEVLRRWLRERRGRVLDLDDIVHFERMVAAIEATLELLPEIDAAVGGWPWTSGSATAS
ncbi:MAG: type ISP restriction/modification enzyme [Conexibacter sp.]